MPQSGEKKKEKRRLGILEMATKEFEDESEVRLKIKNLHSVTNHRSKFAFKSDHINILESQ